MRLREYINISTVIPWLVVAEVLDNGIVDGVNAVVVAVIVDIDVLFGGAVVVNVVLGVVALGLAVVKVVVIVDA